MPRLPDVMDFGARPSLRSNRVDPVHPEGVEIAESVAQAAGTFAKIYGEKQQKDSRLQYALAKNEITALDIAQRESLKDRRDWEKFDEDYTNGFNTGRDEIIGRYNRLSASDQALLSSESDLIRERGRVAAGSFARGMEIDQGRTTIDEGLENAVGAIQIAEADQQNELMLQALETVTAAVEEGWFTEQEGLDRIQGFVAKAAVDSLENMSAEDMVKEIELSLAHRKARGALTREDIAAGKGSDSIADFLDANMLKKMLEEGKEEHKNEVQYGKVYEIIDAVTAEFPDSDQASLNARNKAALAMLNKGDDDYAEVRRRLEDELSQRNNRDMQAEGRAEAERALEVTNWIDSQVLEDPENPPTIGQLRTMPIWPKLSPQSKATLEAYVQQRAEGHEYALADDDDFDLEWAQLSPKQKIKAIPDFDTAAYKTRMTRDTWNHRLNEADSHRNSAERPGTLKIWRGDAQDEVLQNMLVGEEGLFHRVPVPGTEADRRFRRIDAAVNRALTEESLRRVRDGGTGEITPEDVEQITGKVLSREIYVRQGMYGRGGDRRTVEAEVIRFDVARDPTGERVAVNIELEEGAEDAYIPIENWRNNQSDMPDLTDPSGTRKLTVEQMLRNLAPGEDVSDKALEEAYFYLNALPEKTGLDYAGRALRGELGPAGEAL